MPEIFLVLAFVVFIILDLAGTIQKSKYPQSTWHGLMLGILVWTIVLVYIQGQRQQYSFLFGDMLFLDIKAVFFKILILVSALVLVLHSWATQRVWAGEFYALLIAIVWGLLVMTMAINLLSIYLSIEIVSLASYLLTAFLKDKKSTEAGIKYLLFGAISSAIMLYGMSLMYGLTGTLNLADPQFAQRISQTDGFVQLVVGGLVLAGLLYKISAVPFHFWNPDVYEAVAMPVVSFFSVAPKAAGLLVLLRFLSIMPTDFQDVLAVVSLLSISIGNFSALWQTKLKRLLAFSGIAQIGFILIGFVAFSSFGIKASVFYIASYLFSSMGTFFLIDIFANNQDNQNIDLNNFQGLGIKQPLMGILLIISLLSLVGLPLTVGFTSKLFVFSSLWEHYQQNHQTLLLILLVWGLFNTAIALFYYLKIPFMMFFRVANSSDLPEITITPAQKILALGLVIPIVLLFLKSDWLMNFIEKF